MKTWKAHIAYGKTTLTWVRRTSYSNCVACTIIIDTRNVSTLFQFICTMSDHTKLLYGERDLDHLIKPITGELDERRITSHVRCYNIIVVAWLSTVIHPKVKFENSPGTY